jgi:hypothetical protein
MHGTEPGGDPRVRSSSPSRDRMVAIVGSQMPIVGSQDADRRIAWSRSEDLAVMIGGSEESDRKITSF